MNRLVGKLSCYALLLVTGAVDASAAERSNIRGLGMARTFVACSHGLDAVGINPAGLGFSDVRNVVFSIVPLGVHAGSDFLNYDLYSSYFTGVETDSGRVAKHLQDADKQKILNSFQDDIARTTVEAEVRLLGVLVRVGSASRIAFTVTEQAGLLADVPRDYATFLLLGNPPGSRFDFSNGRVAASWRREYALAFGTQTTTNRFPGTLAYGIAVKLVEGYGYYDVQRFNTTLNTSPDGTLSGTIDFLSRQATGRLFNGNSGEAYSLFPEVVGSGLGFDVGVESHPSPFLSVGISITDIGTMRWSKGVEEVRAESTMVVENPLQEQQRSAIEDVVKGKRGPGSAFSTRLPTTLRLGAAIQVDKLPAFKTLHGELLVALDYNQGLEDVPGTTTTPRVSLGVEYKPSSWLPLRSGLSFGGTDGHNLALGFGIRLGPVEFDVASENTEWLFAPKSFSRGSMAAGLTVEL